MRIKRLYIGDFGILRNQTLDDIKPGIVVVGGRNRSGKSTLMKVLRYLCSGFTKNGPLPPAKTKYRVEADIIPGRSNDICTLKLEGYSAPQLFSGSDKEYTIDDLYPDDFTYKHLYTISLDQLAALPPDLEGKDGVSRLQSALLGAGLSDIAGIPRLEKNFEKVAEGIGGKSGAPNVRNMKNHYDDIVKGIEKRKAALGQVDAYRREKQELQRLEDQKKSLDENIRLDEARLDVLECLVNTYDDISKIKDLTARLEDHPGAGISDDFPWENRNTVKEYFDEYKDISVNRDEMLTVIKSELDDDMDAGRTVDLLLGLRDRITEAYMKLPMIDDRLGNLANLKTETDNEKNLIMLQLENLGISPTETELRRIEGLNLDPARESELMKLADRAKEIREEKRGLELKLDQYTREQVKSLKEQDRLSAVAGSASTRPYVLIMIVAALAGIALSIIYLPLGLLTGLGGIAVGFSLAQSKNQVRKDALIKLEETKAELDSINEQLDDIRHSIDKLQAESTGIRDRLDDTRHELGIAGDLSPDMTLDCFRRLSDVKNKLLKHKGSLEKIKDLERSISDEVSGMTRLLHRITTDDLGKEGDIVTGVAEPIGFDPGDWVRIKLKIEKWHGLLVKALELNKLNISLSQLRAKLHGLMGPGFDTEPLNAAVNSFIEKARAVDEYKHLMQQKAELSRAVEKTANSERVRKAAELTGCTKNGSVTEYLFDRHGSYSSWDEARSDLDQGKQRLKAAQAHQVELVKQIQSANDRLNDLALTDKLEEAHRMITSGQAQLRPLAYRYAVNRAAAFLCREIKYNFLSRMGKELLGNARDILSELTGGEYKEIAPCEDLISIDYTFTLNDGTMQDSVKILSRGTQEQVFLAVRLGRIMGSKPAPVIIDDSFVNFDARHLENAVRILKKLSETHQIFIMTCHPHMVRLLEEEAGDCQYWKLEKGKFELSDADRLYDHLKAAPILAATS